MKARAAAIQVTILAVLMAAAASASAVTITLGTPDPSQGTEALAECELLLGCATATVVPTELGDPGATLSTPADGTIVSWRVKGFPPNRLRLRTLRAEPDGSFKAIGTSGVAQVSDGIAGNPITMAIDAGQQLGIELTAPPSTATVLFGAPASDGAWSSWQPSLADGATAQPSSAATGSVPLFNATVELFRPQLFQVSPAAAPAGVATPVYLTGRHLTEVSRVSFGGVRAPVLEQIPEQVLVLAPPQPPGAVDVTLETAGGANLGSAADDFTYLGPAPPPDTSAPRVFNLKVSPDAFLAAASGPSAIASAALGADVSYRLSEPATTTFRVLRRKGKRYLGIGSFEQRGEAGGNRFRFSGRVGRRALPPGRYRLLARARDNAGNRSKARTRAFAIVRD